MEYEFFVEGTPVAQARPRFSMRCGYPVAYDSRESKDFKLHVYKDAWNAFKKGGGKMLEGPLSLELTVYRTYPSSWSRIKGERANKFSSFR
ncbi:MAG: RusA family crossover junction endodeoxyribonuclease [Sphaerochaeta sp.]